VCVRCVYVYVCNAYLRCVACAPRRAAASEAVAAALAAAAKSGLDDDGSSDPLRQIGQVSRQNAPSGPSCAAAFVRRRAAPRLGALTLTLRRGQAVLAAFGPQPMGAEGEAVVNAVQDRVGSAHQRAASERQVLQRGENCGVSSRCLPACGV